MAHGWHVAGPIRKVMAMSRAASQEGTTSPAATFPSAAIPGAPEAATTPAVQVAEALSVASVHLLSQPLDLARAIAGCTGPAELMAVSLRWSAGCMDQLLSDQARLMAAFMALAAPTDQARGDGQGRDGQGT
jgi:hypothetical protein